jgi:Ca2+-binding RTX toxin-like protein
VEGFNVGVLSPVHAGVAGASLDGAFLRNYVNIAFEQSADPTTLAIQNVSYAPSRNTRVAAALPATVANVWHEGHAVIQQGEMSPELPAGLPESFPVKVDLRENGELRLTSSDLGDKLDFRREPSGFKLVVNGSALNFGAVSITTIIFWGNGGDDRFVNDTYVPLLAFGGDGDDLLIGGSGKDRLIGNSGDDILDGGSGDDFLYGGEGDDKLFGRAGRDKLRGEAGNDQLFGGSGDDWILDGGAGNDLIFGEDGDDVTVGGDGDDTLDGGNGHDSLSGAAGRDQLSGGAGDDILNGGDGDDQLFGGPGRDKLWGGPGDDLLWFDLFDWLIDGGPGKNRFRLR